MDYTAETEVGPQLFSYKTADHKKQGSELKIWVTSCQFNLTVDLIVEAHAQIHTKKEQKQLNSSAF